MADETQAAPHRVPMTLPGASYVIQVPEEHLEARLEAGWKKVRASRRADTGTVPVQNQTPAQSTGTGSSGR